MPAPKYAFMLELAKSFRRIVGSRPDGDLATIWHQGKAGAELLSWEKPDGSIARQELTFYGQVVIAEEDAPAKTATVPTDASTTNAGMGKSDLMKMDPTPSERILEQAEALLAAVSPSDRYYECLLASIRATRARH
jgi:hypothetical protein